MIWVMQLFSSTVFGGPCVTSNILHNILGIQLQKNLQALPGLRFTDDILLFALSPQQDFKHVKIIGFVFATSQLGIECLDN